MCGSCKGNQKPPHNNPGATDGIEISVLIKKRLAAADQERYGLNFSMKKTFLIASLLWLTSGGTLHPSAFVVANPAVVTPATSKPVPPSPVELLNPGAKPRKPLRFNPAPAIKQLGSMTLNMDMSITTAGTPAEVSKMPGTAIKFEATVTKVEPNGNIHYLFRYLDFDAVSDPNLPPATAEKTRSQFNTFIRELKGMVVVNNRGQTLSINFVIPDKADPLLRQIFSQLSQSIDQFSAPLPEAAIGIGAQWRVTRNAEILGMNLQQTAIYELVNFQDGVATLNVGVKQQVPVQSQVSSPPESASKGAMQIKSLNSSGQGQTRMQMNRLIPLSAKLDLQSKVEMEVRSADSKAPTLITTVTSVEMVLTSE
jgi:hypothetical protein